MRNASSPVLVVDRIEIDQSSPSRVTADIRLGDRPDHVIIDLSIPSVVSYERMPDALERHRSAQRAVLDLMMQKCRGDMVSLPIDLSDAVREASEPWPARVAGEGVAASVPVEVFSTERDQPDPGLMTVRMEISGIPTVVVVDIRGGPQQAVRFRFAEGVHPWQMTAEEQPAVLAALLTAARARSDLQMLARRSPP